MKDLKLAVLDSMANQSSDVFMCEKHKIYSVMDGDGCPVCNETERIIRIAEIKAGHPYEYSLCNCEWCQLVYLVKDVNVL